MSDSNFQREEIFAKSIRAGKRTYFFDVKSTRANDYYLTITESKRRFGDDGTPVYEKHKIFLYKEDFNKFTEALNNTVNHVKTQLMPEVDFSQFDHAREFDHSREEHVEAEETKETGSSELKWD